MPFIFVSILLPFAWKLSKTTDASFQLYQLTVSLLQAQSDRVNNGLVPDPLALKEIQDNSLTMGETVYTIASQFRVIWIIQNAFCIVLSIVSCFIFFSSHPYRILNIALLSRSYSRR